MSKHPKEKGAPTEARYKPKLDLLSRGSPSSVLREHSPTVSWTTSLTATHCRGTAPKRKVKHVGIQAEVFTSRSLPFTGTNPLSSKDTLLLVCLLGVG